MEITFNTTEQKLIVMFENGDIKEYIQADKDVYIADYPDRIADIIAMGWDI